MPAAANHPYRPHHGVFAPLRLYFNFLPLLALIYLNFPKFIGRFKRPGHPSAGPAPQLEWSDSVGSGRIALRSERQRPRPRRKKVEKKLCICVF
jgi:hypothetical protein